jgi:hypothetical protein
MCTLPPLASPTIAIVCNLGAILVAIMKAILGTNFQKTFEFFMNIQISDGPMITFAISPNEIVTSGSSTKKPSNCK